MNKHLLFLRTTIFLCAWLTISFSYTQNLQINEIMSSNNDFISDEYGSYEDWIELYNAGDLPVNLEGYGLTDDYTEPFKWVFPAYEMQAGEYLLIWASSKDKRTIPGEKVNGIQRLFYPNIPGTDVDNLINHQSFPDHPASTIILSNGFEAPANIADHYGQHLITWLLAPQSGYYTFHISSDDNSRLFLSSDETLENSVLIAEVPGWTSSREWDKYPEQSSQGIYLEEGQRYYLSALMKEGEGGDHLAVKWDLPNGTTESIIKAEHCFIPSTFFHTNFSINAQGEEILLTRPDGIIQDEVIPIAIPGNISYGRAADVGGEWGYFTEPTPGEINFGTTYDSISEYPVISPDGGVFRDMVNVSIVSPDPDAEIYYTLNGTIPSESNGMVYQQPFSVNSTVYLRAVAISEGKLPSTIAASTFSILHNDLSDFSTNLPLMVVNTLNSPVEYGEKTLAFMSIIENEVEGRYKPDDTPSFMGRVEIGVRGSSSQMFPKKGYGFHTLEEDGSNRKVSLLGMPEEHNWILHGPYADKSLMRNAVSYSLGRSLGSYTPRARFVELFLNTGTGQLRKSHYRGIYLLVERIKIAPGRLEIESLEPYQNSYPEITGGYIFKIDRLNSGEEGFMTQRNSHFVYYRPNEFSISEPQKEYLTAYIDSLETALFGANFAHPDKGYAAWLDVPSFIDMHLITELTKEIDGFRLSTFFFKDRLGKISAGPMWDFNFSLGNAEYVNGWSPTGWYHDEINDRMYNMGWYKRLFQDPDFNDRYKRRYRSLRLSSFSNSRVQGEINRYYSLLNEAQQRNFEKWNILGTYIWPNWFIAQSFDEEINWMSDWVRQRIAWMDQQLGEPYTMMHYWNFNDESLRLPAYSISSANLSIDASLETETLADTGADFSGMNSRNNDLAKSHLRVNFPVGAQMVFYLPSKGYQNLIFTYEARRSGFGANRHFVSYTTDAETFIPLDTLRMLDKPQVYAVDFKGIPDVDDNPLFAVKIIIGFDPNDLGGLIGNNRLDNVSLDGEAMPGVTRPPVMVEQLSEYIELIENQVPLSLELKKYFHHPDGHQLQYSIDNPRPDMATVEIVNNQLTISPLKRGGCNVQLTVNDGINPAIERSFYLLVYPEAAPLSEESFVFDQWSPDEPEGSFPEHMIFLQSQEDDPQPATSFMNAYSIPASEYSITDQHNIGFPYRNQSRTRINGLNDNGISFINTGRGRDLGAALLAIDARNIQDMVFSWKASTIQTHSLAYNIRLQYRTNIASDWKSWMDGDGNPVEYVRNSFDSQTFYLMALPDDAVNKPYVQLRWLYYFTGNQLDALSGARDKLALNKIVFSVPTSVDFVDADEPLRAFPNPSKNGRFYFNKSTSGQLLDMQGRVMAVIHDSRTISTWGIGPGLYLFRSIAGETIKVIVD